MANVSGQLNGLDGSYELTDHDNGPEGSQDGSASSPQVFHIEIIRETVSEMRRAVKVGASMSIGFGKHMMLRYGRATKSFHSRPSKFDEDIYHTSPADATTTVPRLKLAGNVAHHLVQDVKVESKPRDTAAANEALSRMKNQYDAIKQEKLANQTTIRDEAVDPRRKQRLKANNVTKPVPPSTTSANKSSAMSMSSAGSPIPANTSAASDRAQKYALIHLLAVQPISKPEIHRRTGIYLDALARLLDSVAEKVHSRPEAPWTLIGRRFKDLEPWEFPYKTEDRTRVIDNAIHALDKLRLNPQDPIWQRLLRPNERGKGKTLSRLHLFPADHRKLLNGIANHDRSQPGTPVHSRSADHSEAESNNSVRKPAKKQDLIANAKKRLAGNRKVDRPQNKDDHKTIDDTKKRKQVDKASEETSASTPVGKRRKVLSDDVVHSSDDESLPISDKPAAGERLKANSSQSQSQKPTSSSEEVKAQQRSSQTQDRVVQPTSSKSSKAGQKSSVSQKPISQAGAETRKKTEIVTESKNSVKRQMDPAPGPPAKKVKTSNVTPEKTQPETSPSNSSVSKRSSTEMSGSQQDSPSKKIKTVPKSLENVPKTHAAPKSDAHSLDTYEKRTDAAKPEAKPPVNTHDQAPKPKSNKASSSASSGTENKAPENPLTRRQTLAAYRQYFRYFKAYNEFHSKLLGKSEEELTDEHIADAEARLKTLNARRDALERGFEAMHQEVKERLHKCPDKIVTLDDKDEDGKLLGVMTEAEMRDFATTVRERFDECGKRYHEFLQHHFGTWEPEKVEQLWDDLDAIDKDQKAAARATALECGAKQEANLKDVELVT